MKKIDQYSVKTSAGIVLNANESYQNISADILEEIKEAMDTIAFQRYPEDSNQQVREAYAQYLQMDADQIIVGNGSDEMLGLLIGLEIKEGKKLYTVSPDFSMYDYYVSMHNGEVVKYKYGIEDCFDVNAFIQKGNEEQVDLIILSNPNNPTGRSIPQQDLIKIIEAFPHIKVVIDEAYADFDETSMLSYVDQYEHVFVTRTLSKAFGLASVRCGFLIGNKKSIAAIVPYKVPYNVNTITQTMARIVLQHSEEMKQRVAIIKQERDALYKAYCANPKQGLTLYPSHTNYLYGVCDAKEALMNAFEQQGVVIRYYQDNSFRITIGSKEENALVLSILQAYEGESI